MDRIGSTKIHLPGGWTPLDFNILTNDPSMTAWGWAVINREGRILATGCIKTKTEGKKRRIRKSDETTQRASEIIMKLLEVIRAFDIKLILSESPHGSQNASAAVMIGMVAGIEQAIADTLGIGIEWYSEGDSKKALLGKISATKLETIHAVVAKLHYAPCGTKYIDEAIADALSVYYCATKYSSTLKMIKR